MFNYQNEDTKGSRDINNQERQLKQVLMRFNNYHYSFSVRLHCLIKQHPSPSSE